MIVDIEHGTQHTLITFKASDFTCLDDIQRIVSATAAGSYCFEASSLLSDEFKQFISRIEPRKSYGIIVGIDEQNQVFVEWGKLKRKARQN